MLTTALAQRASFWLYRITVVASTLATLFLFAQTTRAQNAPAQVCPTPLCLSNNYFVTGDYVVGGVGLRGLGVNGFATGTISIPDTVQAQATGIPSSPVPTGADIVAAFLYWQTVESSQSAFAGQNGFFGPISANGQASRYAIQGAILGNPNAPVSWSSGGCSGSSQGSKTIRTYRADVRPFLSLDANGNPVANGSYQISLADSGSNGGGTPLTLGATLVIIYRVQSPTEPLSSVVLFDGSFAPSNTSSTMTQSIFGFYDADSSPVAEITHIVGNGQANKTESVALNGTNLPSLYSNLPPFPGIYNGSWDNPTWLPANTEGLVGGDATMATTSVTPGQTNTGCVSWGAIIFKTTVDAPDGDGLLKVWKTNQGYTDALSSQQVGLPGATLGEKDIFVELDYLSNLDGKAGADLHSHLPKQQALDMVGNAFAAQNPPIHIHFDVGNVYQSPRAGGPSVLCGAVACDPYIISNPPGTGGNAISEGPLLCTDSGTLCQYPGQVSVGWKGGFLAVKNNASQGNFQSGRKDSYHYVLFGHALASSRTYWPAAGNAPALQPPPGKPTGLAILDSIVVNNNVGTVTLTTFGQLLKPGDCPAVGGPACNDTNLDRVTIEGALQPSDAALNGPYKFLTAPSSTPGSNTPPVPSTTTFTIQTSGVPNGTYNYSNEPQLGLAYGGPLSASGYSDIGGGDSSVTFGLWPADDAPACQHDPSATLAPGQVYCVNQVGTIQAEAGTLLHEIGHTFGLTHGGTLYPSGAVTASGPLAGQQTNSPFGLPSYALNCNPAFLSSMNYLYQVRGFPEILPDGTHPIDYSGQTLPKLDESALNETSGVGLDFYTNATAAHLTRWFAPPNALDVKLQNATGGRFATIHCDGSPIGPNEPSAVRVDGSFTFAPMVDWNNDLIVPNSDAPQDVNFNGTTSDAPFPGFNDWVNLDLRQIGARASTFGASSGSGNSFIPIGGGNSFLPIGGGGPLGAGGSSFIPIGGGSSFIPIGGGNSFLPIGGGEQDVDTANSTADSPTGLSGVNVSKTVVLNWTSPGFGQVREYDIWRAVGSFTTFASAVANQASFQMVGKVTGAPPATTFTDESKLQNKTTYTYFVTQKNAQGVLSPPSNSVAVFVVF